MEDFKGKDATIPTREEVERARGIQPRVSHRGGSNRRDNSTTVRRVAGVHHSGWAGRFPSGTFYVHASTVWRGWNRNKYRGLAATNRGGPIKHKRVGPCPTCQTAVCTRPGVPATRSFSYRMTRQVLMLLRNLGVGDAKISIRRVLHRGEPLVIRVAR